MVITFTIQLLKSNFKSETNHNKKYKLQIRSNNLIAMTNLLRLGRGRYAAIVTMTITSKSLSTNTVERAISVYAICICITIICIVFAFINV